MPFPDPFFPMVIVIGVLASFTTWGFNAVSAQIARSHTVFALEQVAEHLIQIEADHHPIDEESLIASLRDVPIDWNSCNLTPTGIRDPWRNKIRITFDHGNRVWRLRSSGSDCTWNTSDDIAIEKRALSHSSGSSQIK